MKKIQTKYLTILESGDIMLYPWMYPIMMMPIPTIDEEPPTIYYLLKAIVDDDSIKMSELADKGRNQIFDFDYPLTNLIDKKDFECMILNKFMMRRIGTQTLNAFKLNLSVKLNEIMPLYNKLFESIKDWNLFNDGEVITRTQNDNRTSNSNNNITSDSTTNSTNIADRRYSNTPQNKIVDVQDGKYLTEYNYDTDTGINTDTSRTVGSANSTDNNVTTEEIKRSPANKIELYKEFIESKNNIYTMIFKDLDVLFYQLV